MTHSDTIEKLVLENQEVFKVYLLILLEDRNPIPKL